MRLPACSSQAPAAAGAWPRGAGAPRRVPGPGPHPAGGCPWRQPAAEARLAVIGAAAAVEPAPAADAERPPCYQEVWAAPAPSRLIDDKRAFVEQHRIRGYEVGPDQRTTMATVANLLQEVASNHAVAMWGRAAEGYATDPALAAEGLIFVMTRLQVRMSAYPRWGDVVEFETWFQPAGKIGARRDWLVREPGGGRVLGRATSSWAMINLRSRRLAKMPDSVRARLEGYQARPPRDALPPADTRRRIDADGALAAAAAGAGRAGGPQVSCPPSTAAGPGGAPWAGFARQVARRSDVDMNGHINNVVYLGWALETAPPDVHAGCHLYEVEVDFKAECFPGDEVEALAAAAETPAAAAANGAGPGALTYVHALRRCDGGACTELVRARTTWRLGAGA